MENKRTWEEINQQLEMKIKKIFNNIHINELTNHEKRRIIFEYVCEHGNYDIEKLENIKRKGPRDPWDDLYTAIDEQPSICNGFSQYYKLLLEKVGIYSKCICCSDGTEIIHQLNMVKNDDETFSFDDTTSVIVKRGTIEDFFDYDIEQANKLNEGNRPIYIDEETNEIYYWCTLPTELLNIIVKRKNWKFENLNERSGFGIYEEIKSQKNSNSKKI